MRPDSTQFYEFGEFRLDPDEKILWRNDSVIEVTPKAFEILLVLVEHSGRLVTKEDIFKRVWPDSVVEDANLSHHIFRLRKALGETEELKFIETAPKRGYLFVAEAKQGLARSQTGNKTAGPQTGDQKVAGWTKALAVAGIIVLATPLVAYFAWSKFGPANSESRTGLQSPSLDQMTITRITTSGKVAAATVSPDGKFIAYSQNHFDGAGSIFIRQTDTNAEVQLLDPGERIFGSMSFSPDSRFINYILFDQQHTQGALYRIPVLGGQPSKLVDNVNLMFTLSPDGSRATFFRDDPSHQQEKLMVAALDGSGEKTILTRRYHEMRFGICPAWSPDGRLIAFTAAEGPPPNKDGLPARYIFSVEIDSGAVRKLSNDTWIDDGLINWMHDQSGIIIIGERPRTGNQIFFLSYPQGELRRITKELNVYGHYGLGITGDGTALVANLWENSAQLWVIDASGSTGRAEQLTTGISDGARGLTALADGRIVYSTHTGEDLDLWMLSEKEGRREGRPLTDDSFSEGEVCSTPDDRYLVFTSDRVGNQHLFRMNLDGSNVKQLTFGDEFNSAPACAPDGGSVVYVSKKPHSTALWRVSIDGGPPVQITDFEVDTPSISPDGKLIACIIPSESVVKKAKLIVISAQGGAPQKTFEVIPFAWRYRYRPARWTPDGRSLVFHKTEKQIGNLWKQDLAGSHPERLTDFKSEMIFNYAFSPDRTRLFISRGKRTVNVVMLKNFR